MTVATSISICNMALDHLGKPSITSFTDGSLEAATLGRQYPVARRLCLSKSPWTFARKLRSLSLNATNELEDVWAYRYDLPNDMLKLFKLVEADSLVRENTPPIPYYIEGGSLYTNVENAYAAYVYDHENTLAWSTMFDEALSLLLAARAVPQLGRKADAQPLRQLYSAAISEAIELDAQQEYSGYAFHTGGYVDARGATGTRPEGRLADGSSIWG